MHKHGITTKQRRFAMLLCAVMACASLYNPAPAWASVAEEVEDGAVAEEKTDSGSTDLETSGTADENDEPTVDNSEQIADLQNQLNTVNDNLEQYQQEQDRIQSKIDSAQTNKAEAEQIRDSYAQQITLTEQELSALRSRISLLQQDIAQKENQIVAKQQEIIEKQQEVEQKQIQIDESYAVFKTRLRVQYMQESGSVLGLLLGADSFSSFLSRTDTVNRIAEHDRELMQELTEEREELEAVQLELQDAMAEMEETRSLLEASKAQLEEDKIQVEARNKALAVQYQEADSDVQNLEQLEKEFLANLAANQAKQRQMQNTINNLYKQIEFTKNPYVGGEMAWPLPGFSSISSVYGWRFGGSDFHTGMDITGSGCFGSGIVAANDGVVSFVNTAYTPGVGYGIYLIVDHGKKDGKTISTLYAHCSAINVSVGQTVKRGQQIASVGSTGWSTGPHLHFEVRIDGNHVNPASYIGG